MIVRSCIAACLPLVCGVIMIASCKEATVDLRFVPANNQYELIYEEAVTGEMKGNKERHSLGATLLLKANDDSALNINATYKRFWVDLRSATDSMKVDTDHPITLQNNDSRTFIPALWQGVKGLSFNYQMNNLGKLETVGSFTALLHEMTRKILPDSAAANSAQFSQVWDLAASQFSPAAAKAMLQPVFPEYAGAPLKAGDTLTRVYRAGTSVPLTMLQIFRIVEISGDQVTLLLGGSGFSDEAKGAALKASQQGKIIVNRKTGVMESAYIEEMVEGKMEEENYKQQTVIKATCTKL